MEQYTIQIFGQDDYAKYESAVNQQPKNKPDQSTILRRKWWCFDNKIGGAFAAAFHNNDVVATCYISGKIFRTNTNEYVKVYEIGETATDPQHQRKGLFGNLVKAITEYSFSNGAAVVYGTPNAQSTPGYQKLGFEILEDQKSNLNVSANIKNIIAKKVGFSSSNKHQQNSHSSMGRNEISPEQYFNETINATRLNVFSKEYFDWRFKQKPGAKYKFHKINDIYIASRPTNLGDFQFIQISEYISAKKQCRDIVSASIISQLKKINSEESFEGVYFLDFAPTQNIFGGIKHHRILPICMIGNGTTQSINLIANIRNHGLAQLSDCDIG